MRGVTRSVGAVSNGGASGALRAIIVGLAGIQLSMAGCTTSLTTKSEALSDKGETYGTPYRLPMKQFQITSSWELVECTAPEKKPNGRPAGLKYKVKADYKAELVEGESFIIDYLHMTNRFKTGEASVTYWTTDDKRATRFVKSINGTIEGKEPEAFKSAIQTIANVGKTVLALSGAPSVVAANLENDNDTLCTDDTMDAIDEIARADVGIEQIKKESDLIQARFDVLKARLALGRLSNADKREYDRLSTKTDELAAKLAKVKEALAANRTRLTYSETFTFPSSPDSTDKKASFKADTGKATKWLSRLLKQSAADESVKLLITAELLPIAGDATAQLEVAQCPELPDKTRACTGFAYREPINARLRITAPSEENGNQQQLLSDKTESIPQYGRLRILPLRSRWGEKNGLSADFAMDGTPTSISYKALEAGGPKMADVASTASASILELATKFQEAREARENADPVAAEEAKQLAALKRQVELAETQQKLSKLQSTPDQDVESLTAELAVLRLQKERAEIQAAIRAAESK